jgi:nucleoside-diphosphate-sugar epimerase
MYWHNEETNRRYRIGPDLITETPDAVFPWAAELKGGADPAGSDEHWKTATQAFNRIIDAAEKTNRPVPKLSFMATILVDRVAQEAALWLEQGRLISVHNLTKIANDRTMQQDFLNQMVAFFEMKLD